MSMICSALACSSTSSRARKRDLRKPLVSIEGSLDRLANEGLLSSMIDTKCFVFVLGKTIQLWLLGILKKPHAHVCMPCPLL